MEAYGNSTVSVLEKFYVFLRWKGRVYKQLFYIMTANASPNLLSRDGCYMPGVLKPCYSVETSKRPTHPSPAWPTTPHPSPMWPTPPHPLHDPPHSTPVWPNPTPSLEHFLEEHPWNSWAPSLCLPFGRQWKFSEMWHCRKYDISFVLCFFLSIPLLSHRIQ